MVGILSWELEVFGCRSLKEKRGVVKSLKDRLRNRFNISVAETAHHDVWQRAELSACVVATDRVRAEQVLEAADRLVEGGAGVRIVDTVRIFY